MNKILVERILDFFGFLTHSKINVPLTIFATMLFLPTHVTTMNPTHIWNRIAYSERRDIVDRLELVEED